MDKELFDLMIEVERRRILVPLYTILWYLVMLGLILVGMFWFASYDTAISTLPGLIQLPDEIDHGAGTH